jgi:hypothetical protein
MKSKRMFSLIVAVALLVSNITVFAEGPFPGNDSNDGSLNNYTVFNGNTNDSLDEGKYFVKDDDPGSDKNISLGNGYSIFLDYDQDNLSVSWMLNSPINPEYELTIVHINVKASNAYMSYPNGLNNGSQNIDSVFNNGNNKYHEISHVTVAYCFEEIPKQDPDPIYGSITINKDVLDETDGSEFTVTVTGPDSYTTQVAISEGNPVTLYNLELGTYALVESDVAGYIEGTVDDITLTEEMVEKSITFENELENDDPDPDPDPDPIYGSITINKDVLDETDGSEFTVTVTGPDSYTTQVAISEGNPVTLYNLELGTYALVESDVAGYIEGTVDEITLTEEMVEKSVTFENELEKDDPEPPVIQSNPKRSVYKMDIEKEATEDEIQLGEDVDFVISVTNTGNKTLTDVKVVDDKANVETIISRLNINETVEFTINLTPEELGVFNNTASASDNRASYVEDSDSVVVVELEEEIIEVVDEIPLDLPETDNTPPLEEMEEEIPLSVPDTGVPPLTLFYLMGAGLAALGILKKEY